MTQSGKLRPNLDQSSTKILNLTVLQRIDPCIEEILSTVAHVASYDFDIDLNQWSRKDVEGSLFVVKRNKQPRFQFIIMNRRSTENLVENLLGDFEFEVQVPYLLYRNAAQQVNGIWFYNSHECEEVANLFSSEIEELEGPPTIASLEGPLEPSSTTDPTEFPDEFSFSNFFNSGMTLGNNTSNVGNPWQQSYHAHVLPSSSSSASVPPQTPFSAPPPLSPQPLLSAPPPLASPPLPAITVPAPIPPIQHSHPSDLSTKGNQLTNLIKPSSFSYTSSSSVVLPSAPSSVSTIPVQPSISLQHPYGAPLLQPFPPPTPSLSLAPVNPPNYGPSIDRDKVRDALLMLVQDNRFIDMFHQALQKAHQL
ncbi:mRNA-decapping enzyme-like protein [Drosera capensis]